MHMTIPHQTHRPLKKQIEKKTSEEEMKRLQRNGHSITSALGWVVPMFHITRFGGGSHWNSDIYLLIHDALGVF